MLGISAAGSIHGSSFSRISFIYTCALSLLLSLVLSSFFLCFSLFLRVAFSSCSLFLFTRSFSFSLFYFLISKSLFPSCRASMSPSPAVFPLHSNRPQHQNNNTALFLPPSLPLRAQPHQEKDECRTANPHTKCDGSRKLAMPSLTAYSCPQFLHTSAPCAIDVSMSSVCRSLSVCVGSPCSDSCS